MENDRKPLCNVCEMNESYEHLFINCTEIQPFWTKIITVFKQCGIEVCKNIEKYSNRL